MSHVRTTIRGLLHEPAFTTTVLGTLALGIGVCLTMFAVVRAVLLAPLPFPDSERLAALWMTNPRQGFDRDVISYPQLSDWREETRDVFAEVGAFSMDTGSLGASDGAREVRVCQVTQGFFAALGANPAFGRTPNADDFTPGRHRVIVLEHALWRTVFGGDPRIVGREVRFNSEPYTVIGVLAPGASFPLNAEVWTPLAPLPDRQRLLESRASLWLTAIGRLRPGVTAPQAQERLALVQHRLAEAYPDTAPGTGAVVRPLREDLVASAARPVWLLQGAVVLVLLIACANVSNLLLARASSRRRALATRVALGAGRRRLMIEGFLEALLLTAGGAALGLLIAAWLIDLIETASPVAVPLLGSTAIDRSVIAAAGALAFTIALVVGAGPVARSTFTDLAAALRSGGRAPGDSGGSARTREALVAAQLALALVLLVGSGLLIKSFGRLVSVDMGYSAREALTASVTLPQEKYRDSPALVKAWNDVLREVSQVPGVQAAGATTTVLYGNIPAASPMAVEGRPDLPDEIRALPVVLASATPKYFDAIGHRVVSGRSIDERDTADAPAVVVVNEALARTYFDTPDVLGRRVTFGDPADPGALWLTIVGVVQDVPRAAAGPELPARPEAYVPFTRRPRPTMTLVVRGDRDPISLAGPVRAAVSAVDRDVPLARVQSLASLLDRRLDTRRLLMALAGAFAAVAVLLAAIGVYGMMSYTVGRRMHEFGVHLALGASRGRLVRTVIAPAVKMTIAGAAGGAIGGLAIGKLLDRQLYDVSAADPLVFAAVAIVLASAALAACWVPARRAVRADPMRVLRDE